jgi:hypothetical protein
VLFVSFVVEIGLRLAALCLCASIRLVFIRAVWRQARRREKQLFAKKT